MSKTFDTDTARTMPAAPEAVAAVAKALAHPARVRIVEFLISRPGCIGGDIVDEIGLAQSTVSEHLRILKEAGLVIGEIERPRICYRLDASALAPLQALIGQIDARMPERNAAKGCYTPEDCKAESRKTGEPTA